MRRRHDLRRQHARPQRRVAQHRRGEGAFYTRRRLPVRLVYSQEFERIDEAYAMEKRVQGWSRAKRRALVEGRMSELPRLSARRRRRETRSAG
ncbi:GIY-YIG nuclease family protein [Agromyces allii]|uniref:GIY-YIG nuclease family protein n=1 Tax=Agromyces allii TaxID=393607 RepID=UPI001FE55311|nr:GIY-YIG nuclease family protein [Agromyces allii]